MRVIIKNEIEISKCCVCFQLPRAVNTQTLSGAGFLKMINRASDAVNKMTIKMNESDTVRMLRMKCSKTLQQTVAFTQRCISFSDKQ